MVVEEATKFHDVMPLLKLSKTSGNFFLTARSLEDGFLFCLHREL